LVSTIVTGKLAVVLEPLARVKFTDATCGTVYEVADPLQPVVAAVGATVAVKVVERGLNVIAVLAVTAGLDERVATKVDVSATVLVKLIQALPATKSEADRLNAAPAVEFVAV
jgi:hypothetical protein